MAIFFTSYSRLNAASPRDRDLVQRFVQDLASEVAMRLPVPVQEEPGFFDTTNIETGSDWNDELSLAASTSRVALALYSPSYFNSHWCGREFQVFLDRRQQAGSLMPAAIIPVLWMKSSPHSAAAAIQYADGRFPGAYAEVGLRKIMELTKTYGEQYVEVRDLLAEAIVTAAMANALPPRTNVDLRRYPSAWGTPSAQSQSHKSGSVTKACFVYLSTNGWDWQPYADMSQKVGAFAQQIAGELGIRYEELACGDDLPAKLLETNENSVPTILLSDPSSTDDEAISVAMRAYDQQYLLNCGVIVPWQPADSPAPADRRWQALTRLCPQKTQTPPPEHEWRTTFSAADLKQRTITVVESLRLRLLQRVLAQGSPPAAANAGGTDTVPTTALAGQAPSVTRVEDAATESEIAARGLSLHAPPVVSNVPA